MENTKTENTIKCGRCGNDAKEHHVRVMGDPNISCYYAFKCDHCKETIPTGQPDVDGSYSTNFYSHMDQWSAYSKPCNCSKDVLVITSQDSDC